MALVAADILAVALSPVVVQFWRAHFLGATPGTVYSLGLPALILFLALQISGAYDHTALRHPFRALQAVASAWMGATTGVLAILMGQGALDPARDWLPAWGLAGAAVLLVHLLMTAAVTRLMDSGHLRERIVIVGVGDSKSERIIRHVIGSGTDEIQILGLFDDRHGRVPDQVEGYPVLGNTDSLIGYVRANRVDRVVISLPWTAESRVTGLIGKLRQLPVRVDLLPHALIWNFRTDISRICGVPIVTVANSRIDAQLGLLKRVEDVVMATALILLFSPVFILTAVAVRLSSPGPIVFRQKRYGFNNEVFTVYKFRSMYDSGADAPVRQASRGDSRVTLIGRFLRRTSLDEIPQFFNVLEGTMSIVGPRPHAIPHNIEYGGLIDDYYARHNVKPGITGWAQVNGFRGETDTTEKMKRRVEYDLYYIENWSILFDIKVIVMTALSVFFHKAAY